MTRPTHSPIRLLIVSLVAGTGILFGAQLAAADTCPVADPSCTISQTGGTAGQTGGAAGGTIGQTGGTAGGTAGQTGGSAGGSGTANQNTLPTPGSPAGR